MTNKTNKSNISFFNSRSSEIIFYLTRLSGEARANLLNITRVHYSSKKQAEKWYNELLSAIDTNQEFATEAIEILNTIYNDMVK